MNQLRDIGALKADNEARISSKVGIAKKHGISAVTLWLYASNGKWSYGRMREEVLESFSQLAPESLCKLTESVIEEHVIVLTQMRRKMITLDDPKEKNFFRHRLMHC